MSLQFIKAHLPDWLINILRPPYGFVLRIWRSMTLNYDKRIRNETNRFDQIEEVNELPPIFHYWSNRYLRPQLEEVGFSHPDGFFAHYAKRALKLQQVKVQQRSARILSIGSGNCDTEVRLAKTLQNQGFHDFFIDCMDINQTMFARGLKLAEAEGVARHLEFLKADFNSWQADLPYVLIMANQSLHHVMSLEHLFSQIEQAMTVDSYFITSDMIGRNGHQRWPEALEVLKSIWSDMPDRYKYNHTFKRTEKRFINHDCSTEAFEGIRAQDILPLLLEQFDFELCIPFSNLVTIFIDRTFGPNFDVNNSEDLAFIDSIHAIDEDAFKNGTFKPTQMLAAMRLKGIMGENPHSIIAKNAVRYPD